MGGNLLREEWNTKEKRKKNHFKCRYQSVVRLLLRSQPANSALSNTEEEVKKKLPTVKFVPLFRVSDMLNKIIHCEQ
jgi:hypothetical protein